MSTLNSNHFFILVSCKDQPGIIHQLSDLILRLHGNIIEFDQVATTDNCFICRLECKTSMFHSLSEIEYFFKGFQKKFAAECSIIDANKEYKMGIMVSKPSHCLHELLYQVSTQRIPVKVALIVSNYALHKEIAAYYNIPYYHVSVTKKDKKEADILQLVQQETDFLVLARYMQVLSGTFIDNYKKDIINVHHSLLPAFKGGNPYKQAYNHGVKLIGATAHFVTEVLDDGPIIEQDVVQINHRHSVEDIKSQGEVVEKKVLAESCRLYARHRIVRDQTRTVVFK